MEAVVGRAEQVQWALAAGQSGKKSWNGGTVERCGDYGVVRGNNPGVVWHTSEEVLKMAVKAVSADEGGGESHRRERFGRGGSKGGDDGSINNGGSESSDGDEVAPEAASGIPAWYMDQTNRHPVSTKAITFSCYT